MADKHIIEGATFNGDGLSSEEATVDGGTGAWNTITYFEGTTPVAPRTLVAGDVVYIRSKTAAGADITITKTVAQSLGSAVATELAPVTWVFDAGVKWPGISGVVTYNMTTSAAWTVRAYNNLMATNYNLVIKNSNTVIANITWVTLNACHTQSVKFDCSATMTSTGPNLLVSGGVHENTWLLQGSVTRAVICHSTVTADTVFVSLKIDILGAFYFGTTDSRIFDVTSGHSGGITLFGGGVSGSLSGIALVSSSSPSGSFASYGFVFPSSMVVSTPVYWTSKLKAIVNASDGVLGNTVYDYWCEYSSRFDGFYPTLNALLETSSGITKWAYRLHTYRTTPQNPAQIAISKMWTQAAAAKTVTLEILWPTSMAGPTVDKVWITVAYTDNDTGLQVLKTTRAFTGATLTASTNPGWSALTYGATLFTRYKLEIETTGSIKQDTPVMVNLFVIPRAASAAPFDIIMVCPNPVFA